jgi:lipoprotein-anchoring transpeptidase ErfK/SrfK
MSHGCVNVPLGTSTWLYEWASTGTRVEIHY